MIKKRCILKKIILFVNLTFFLLFVQTAAAQQISLSFSPSLMEILIKPGKSIMLAYRLQNHADPTIIRTKVRPFNPKNNRGDIEIKPEFDGPIRFSLDNADLQLEQPFFLKTKDSQQLLLRLRVPEGTPEGDYYYTFLAETEPPPGTEGVTSSQTRAVIGSNLLITVTKTGTTEIKSKIVLFDLLTRFRFNLFGKTFRLADSNDQIPLVLIVENQGKNLIKPVGQIVLKGNFGEKAIYEILPSNILAQSQRLIEATPSAFLNQTKTSSLVLTGFFIGRYQLSASLNFGEGTPYTFARVDFWAFPFKLFLGGLVSFLAIVFVLKKIKNFEE
ncbi:MAG: hypothetical protein QHH09_00270 [Microgenomates group bacterium]|nr:hypothetical protein [Microgenomates group bacterium]